MSETRERDERLALDALINCGHRIDHSEVRLYADGRQAGNALFQAVERVKAALGQAREAALREALAAVAEERLEDPNPESEGDEAYQRAIRDAENAIRRRLGVAEVDEEGGDE